MHCLGMDLIDFVAAGRPLDLAAAVKPVCLEPRKLGSSHRARKVNEKRWWGRWSGMSR